jgi:hypothetical protein
VNRTIVDNVVSAVLYEGYILYPYRPSLKNRQRWTFGGLYPRAYCECHPGSDAWSMQTQCLMEGDADPRLGVTVRFLHLLDRRVEYDASDSESPFAANSMASPIWQEAVEREITLMGSDEASGQPIKPRPVVARPAAGSEVDVRVDFQVWARDHRSRLYGLAAQQAFEFPFRSWEEPVQHGDAEPSGVIVRTQRAVRGTVRASAEWLEERLWRITVVVENDSPLENAEQATRDDALMRSLVSTHAVLSVQGGQFVSLTDPPSSYREAAAACRNVGVWPVLVGEKGMRDTMLASPIILYDYPQVAPESPGQFFDSTEIDELLSLRILTLTDDEKRAMAAVDPQTSALLERTEAWARQQRMELHGAMRGLTVQPVEK